MRYSTIITFPRSQPSSRTQSQAGPDAYSSMASFDEFLRSPNMTSMLSLDSTASTPRHRPSLPLPSSRDMFPCLWSAGCCGIGLDDISAGGLWRHFRDVHSFFDKHGRVYCQWGVDGGCGLEMNCGSLGNHISTVHMKTTGQVCPRCGRRFTRGDALGRHIKRNSCPDPDDRV